MVKKRSLILIAVILIIIVALLLIIALTTIHTGQVVKEDNNQDNQDALVKCLNDKAIKIDKINMNAEELQKLEELTGCK